MLGNGLSFDGSDDFVSIGDPVSEIFDFDGSTSFSYGAWIKPQVVDGTGRRIISKRGGTGAPHAGFDLAVWDGADGLMAELSDGTTEWTTFRSPIPLTLGQWHSAMVVVDRAADRMCVYLDGVEKVAVDIAGLDSLGSSAPLSLGQISGGGGAFAGMADDVRIYDRALSASEVAALAAPHSSLDFLTLTLSTDQVTLDWSGAGRLEWTPSLPGAWTPIVPVPTPPYSEPVAPEGHRFFRLNGGL